MYMYSGIVNVYTYFPVHSWIALVYVHKKTIIIHVHVHVHCICTSCTCKQSSVIFYLQKRLLDKQQDTASKKAKLSTSIAYKHSSVVPRDADVQNFRIFVGKLMFDVYIYCKELSCCLLFIPPAISMGKCTCMCIHHTCVHVF